MKYEIKPRRIEKPSAESNKRGKWGEKVRW